MANNKPTSKQPPVAARKPHSVKHHGVTLSDDFAWLRDPGYPEVTDTEIIAHLESENAWFNDQMAPLEELTETIFSELKGRQPEEDESVPYRQDGWMYQWRFARDAQYRTWWRWPEHKPEGAQCILDEPTLAGASDFFRIGGMSISPDGRFLAYGVDNDGSERYTLFIRDLVSSTTLEDEIPNTGGGCIWAKNSTTFFYTCLSEQWRPYMVARHTLGQDNAEDTQVYTESDDSFFVGVSSTQSDDWIIVSSGDHVTSELRIIPSATPNASSTLIAPRVTNRQYDIDHLADEFYVLTNDTHKNFRLAKTPVNNPGPDNWITVIEGSDDRYLTDFVCFDNLIVVEERVKGLDQILLLEPDKPETLARGPKPLFICTAMAHTDMPYRQAFHLRDCRCWIAASFLLLRTFAVAMTLAITGTKQASCNSGPTPLTILWTLLVG